jgi:5-methylcytosine-specific restriction endonuclease McrA
MRGGLPRKNDFRQTRRWKVLRLLILHRDLWQCQIQGPRCRHTANEVDHITPPNGDETLKWAEWNLRAACGPCNNGRNNPALANLPSSAKPIRFFSDTGYSRAPLANLSPEARHTPLVGDYSRRRTSGGDSAA